MNANSLAYFDSSPRCGPPQYMVLSYTPVRQPRAVYAYGVFSCHSHTVRSMFCFQLPEIDVLSLASWRLTRSALITKTHAHTPRYKTDVFLLVRRVALSVHKTYTCRHSHTHTCPLRIKSVDSSTQALRQATPSSSQRTVIQSHAGDTRRLTPALSPSGPLVRAVAPSATTAGTTNTDMASLYCAT